MASFLMAFVGYVDYQILKHTEDKVDIITEDIYPIIGALQEIRHYSHASLSSASGALMHAAMSTRMSPEEDANDHQRNTTNSAKNITALREATNKHLYLVQNSFPDELAQYEKIAETTQKIKTFINKALTINDKIPDDDRIILLHQQLIQLNDEINNRIEIAITHEQLELDEHHEQIEELVGLSLQKSMIVTGIAFIVLLLLWGFVNRKISRPLIRLRNATTSISKGSFDTRVEIDSNDEIGELAKAINNMSEELGKTTVSRDYVANVIRSMADALFVLDINGEIKRTNKATQQLLGFSKDELKNRNIADIVPEIKNDQELFNSLMAQESFNRREAHLISKDGQSLSVYLTCSQLHDAAGNQQGMVLLAQDVSSRKQAEQRLHYLANFDPLTGLSNRAMLFERLADAISQPLSDRRNVGLLLCGLDRFKLINDTLGHQSGDQLLKTIAQRLQRTIRSNDTVARIGGDEFAIVMPGITDPDEIKAMAERIIDSISGPMELSEHEIFLSLSLGISLYPFDGVDPLTLLRSADIALCQAKDQGKNQYMYYADVSGTKSTDHLKLESDLQHAIERDELRVYYQPQIDIEQQKIISCEALIRWHHPSRGMVSPAEFLPAAEETGMIVDIGRWVLKTACADAKQWVDAGHSDLKVAVNLSDQEFKDTELLDYIASTLQKTGLSAANLELEITENIVMHSPKSAEAIMHRIREMGIELSIDDFGTGYSSLSHLKRFPINTIKIDRSFVIDIVDNEDDKAIVEAILAIAKKMKLKIIAEGVENIEQQDFLKQNGCFIIQGFYYSPAIPTDKFTALLKDQTPLFQTTK